MKVWTCIPYRTDKNLGRAYNEFMQLIPDGDWACLIDYDVQLLTPDAGHILDTYVRLNQDAGILTCFTNRISSLSHLQLLNGKINEDSDIRNHIHLAEEQKRKLFNVTEITRDISGFLMVISKETWKEIKFDESGKCLGVDTKFNRKIRDSGKKILRCDGLYVFHQYRLLNGVADKKHLL